MLIINCPSLFWRKHSMWFFLLAFTSYNKLSVASMLYIMHLLNVPGTSLIFSSRVLVWQPHFTREIKVIVCLGNLHEHLIMKSTMGCLGMPLVWCLDVVVGIVYTNIVIISTNLQFLTFCASGFPLLGPTEAGKGAPGFPLLGNASGLVCFRLSIFNF